jgi:hypothetical protein
VEKGKVSNPFIDEAGPMPSTVTLLFDQRLEPIQRTEMPFHWE